MIFAMKIVTIAINNTQIVEYYFQSISKQDLISLEKKCQNTTSSTKYKM